MDKPVDLGTNRTGIQTSPFDSAPQVVAAEEVRSNGRPDGKAIEAERVMWSRSAPRVGSVPPPVSIRGVVRTVLEATKGHEPSVFVDKLGERLAFERSGTRLYEALIAKLEAATVDAGGPTRLELERIHSDEHRHFLLVCDAMKQLGADPTAITPSADLIGVASSGWGQVLTDPRTTLTQCLDILLIAELADVEGWSLLIVLADGLGFEHLAGRFRNALIEEQDHMLRVRRWLTAALLGQAGAAPTPPHPFPDGGVRSSILRSWLTQSSKSRPTTARS
jgi:hypothetical protein